jgi:hypothetical protein
MLVVVVIPRSGDARYLMPDIQEGAVSDIQKQSVSRNQYLVPIHNPRDKTA